METLSQFGPLFTGRLVRLAAPTPDDHTAFARWSEQDGYQRGFDNDPAKPISAEAHAEWERPFLNAPNSYLFRLRTLEDDRLIGPGALSDVRWVLRTAMLGLAARRELFQPVLADRLQHQETRLAGRVLLRSRLLSMRDTIPSRT